MNLALDPWIPIRRASGKEERIAPWQLTEKDDPIVALAAPRPDFNGALVQFLIGLLQTAAAPKDDEEWADLLESPPPPELLRKRFEKYAHAFELDKGERLFMQEPGIESDMKRAKIKPISYLLIDAPTDQTTKENKDHFIKRDADYCLCYACAATALLTLQLNAGSGGAGHRTSLRGGGPLTTLVVPDSSSSDLPDLLWITLYLNILPNQLILDLPGSVQRNKDSDVFPWLGPVRTSQSKTGRKTNPTNVHPLQMYWNMPRRIIVLWSQRLDDVCSICAKKSDKVVSSFLTRNYGINYSGPFQHPLSPHFIDADTGNPQPLHVQPGGIPYRHWPSIVGMSDKYRPAVVVSQIYDCKLPDEQLRIWAFGYDMDKMKARCWYEATFPLFMVDSSIREDFAIVVADLILAASLVGRSVAGCVKKAWFARPGEARGDTSFILESFYGATEQYLYEGLQELISGLSSKDPDVVDSVRIGWHKTLMRAAWDLFDHYANSGDIANGDPERIAEARLELLKTLNGKKLRDTLHLPQEKEGTK